MSAETVTIPTPDGKTVTLPRAQAERVALCLREFRARGVPARWHQNDCGCCVTVHEAAEHVTSGYLVGADGGCEWLEDA